MESLPKELIMYILNLLPNVNSLKLNRYLYSIVVLHPENDFWKNYDEDKIYRCGKSKMFDIIPMDLDRIYLACTYNNSDIIKYFIQTKNIRNYDDMLVQYASRNGCLDIIQSLVAKNADIHTNDDYSFLLASDHGHLNVVEYLVSKKVNIHVHNEFALQCASHSGHLDIVKFLVSQKANVCAEDSFALQVASKSGHLDIVKFLVNQNANIYDDENLAIRWAIQHEHVEIVKYLISCSVNINDNILKVATESNNADIIQCLLNKQ